MSWHQHDAWTTTAIGKLAQAKKLKKKLDEGGKAVADDTPEIKALLKQESDLKSQLRKVQETIMEQRSKVSADHRKSMAHVQRRIEELNAEAKEEQRKIPQLVLDFIKHVTNGVDWSAGFQIVWYNHRFAILRLAGRRYFGGIGMRSYAQAETKLYDLSKFNPGKGKGSFGALDMERHCTVDKVEGRVTAAKMKEWKETANYVAT